MVIQLQKKKTKPKNQQNKDKGESSPLPEVVESKDGKVTIQVSKQQMNNIINVKKATELTHVDDLKFENGKLRTMLEMWSDQVYFEGKLYLIQVDPLNRLISMLEEKPDNG